MKCKRNLSRVPAWEIVASCGMWKQGVGVGPRKKALSPALCSLASLSGPGGTP